MKHLSPHSPKQPRRGIRWGTVTIVALGFVPAIALAAVSPAASIVTVVALLVAYSFWIAHRRPPSLPDPDSFQDLDLRPPEDLSPWWKLWP